MTATTANYLLSDALPLVDCRLLSHSDLLSLSLSSSSPLPLQNDADLSTPRIDRSVFNESAGSRKQTFSRLRLDPPRNNYSKFVASPKSSIRNLNPSQSEGRSNVIEKENPDVVSLLKSFFGCEGENFEENDDNALFPVPVAVPLQYSDVFYLRTPEDVNASSEFGVKKRKRGRPRKDERNVWIAREFKEFVARSYPEKEGEVMKVSEGGEGEIAHAEEVNVSVVGTEKRRRGRPRKNNGIASEGKEIERNVGISSESKAIVACNDVEKEEEVVNEGGGKRENVHLESAEDVKVHVSAVTELVAKKRKRGRPRKDERNAWIVGENNAIVMRKVVEKETEVGEKENVREEDPYAEELRRRTEGMRTKGELQGYLEGVEGVWVGRRKKSRIVNVAEFGGVLPVGWKLVISVKRRAGFAWLACKRYISPNGQQFVSCKEASSYLQSLSGLQGASITDSGQKDVGVHVTHSLIPGDAADSSVKDDKNVHEPVCGLAFPISPSTGKIERQTVSLENSAEVLVGKEYKCHKCSMTFNMPDDLLQHFQVSHQTVPKRLRHSASVAEKAIMIDGKYQCQLCHKTYEERHRFNGHLGNHIKDYLKKLDVSGGAAKSQKNSMCISTGVLSIDLKIPPIRHDSNDSTKSGVQYFEIKSKTDGASNVGRHVGSQSSSHGALTDQACTINGFNRISTDLVVDLNLENTAASSFNSPAAVQKTFGDCKPSDEAKVFECTIDRNNKIGNQVSSQSSAFGTSRDQAGAVNYNLNQMSIDLVADHNLEKAHVSSSNSQAAMQKTFGNFNVEDARQSFKIQTVEIHTDVARKERLIAGPDSSGNSVANGVIGNSKERKKFVAPSGNYQRDLIVNKLNSPSPSTVMESCCQRGSKGGSLSSSEERTDICASDVINVSTGALNESKFDELGKSGINDQNVEYGANSTVTIEEAETSKGERSYGNCYTVASVDRTPALDDNIYGTFKRTGNRPHPEKGTENTRLNLSSSKQSLEFEPDTVKVNSAAEVHSQNWFCSSENECSGGNAFGPRRETNIQLQSPSNVWLVQPANSQNFPQINHGNYDRNPVEKLTPYRKPVEKLTPYRNPSEKLMPYRNPDNSLHRPSEYKQSHYDKNNVNGSKTESYGHNEVQRSCNTESHFSFGHGGTKPESNVSVEADQESDYPFYPPGYQPTVQTEPLTAVYCSNMHDQKRMRNSTDASPFISGREQPQNFENSLNLDFLGGNHAQSKLEDSKFSRKNEVLNGFNNQIPSNEQSMSDFMWRNDDLLHGFVDTSSHVGQTASGFPACDVMSDKGEIAFFGEKFDGTTTFEGLRSGGVGNMEFDFLNALMDSQSSESKSNALNAGAAQVYGSSVWTQQKDAQRMERQHRIVCIYCRNEFQFDSFESAAQANSMGFTCAACKAKFCSPFNFL